MNVESTIATRKLTQLVLKAHPSTVAIAAISVTTHGNITMIMAKNDKNTVVMMVIILELELVVTLLEVAGVE